MIDCNGRSLLIFDCNDEYLFRNKIFLEQKGYVVSSSSTFEEFIAQLKQHLFDLIIFNWDLPKMTPDRVEGMGAAKNNNPDLAVIITTPSDQPPDLKNVNFEVLEFLRKPFPIWELSIRVSNVLQTMELRKELEKSLFELVKLKENFSIEPK